MERPLTILLLVYLIISCSNPSISMTSERDYFHDHEEIVNSYSALYHDTDSPQPKRRLPQKKCSSKGLYERLEDKKNTIELENIGKAFKNIDYLFSKTAIKIKKLDKNNEPISEKHSTLLEFLSKPHNADKIINIIENSIFRKLTKKEIELIKRKEYTSLQNSIKTLWRFQSINDERARSITLKHSIMNSQELIKLIENGATKTASGYLVQLRTGSTYGDALKLFEDVSKIIKKLKESGDEELANLSLDIYNKKPLNKEVLKLLNEQGINAQDILSDAHVIREMRRHFLFISRIGIPIRFRPGTADFYASSGAGSASVDRDNYVKHIINPGSLSATIVGNHYINSRDASLSNSLYVNPMGINYYGSLNFDSQGADWWLSYSDGYLGGGSTYTVNFDQGTFWSNGQPSFLAVGFMAAGWRDYLTAGFSLSTVLANSVGIGINATMSISRAHDVSYLGQYPIDGKFASIRGMHKIEINDSKGVQMNGTIAINPAGATIPLNVAFRASVEHTTRRIYRTHVPFERAQSMLSESEIRGVLFLLGKKIKETRLPKFENPEVLIDGDELVETKMGRLSGAFVIGVQSSVPLSAARIGGIVDIIGEFELGIRKFPNDKFEVSIEPRKVIEMGLFASFLNLFSAGYIKSIAIARKQIFMFDFMQPEAKKAYFDLIHHGRLPTSEDIEVYTEDRGPEYLLTEFRAQNQSLRPRGIARTYLEKVRVETTKKHIGLNAPLIPAILKVINKIDKKTRKSKDRINLKFEGIDRDFIRSHAKSVATNGLISVRRQTYGSRRSEGQGFSGRYNQDLFVTHRRIHAIDESNYEFAGNKWQFDSLVVHGQLEDTVITGDEENAMAQKINHLFSTFIGSFEYKNSKSPRVINIEREFSKRDLDELTRESARDRISVASQTTGIDQTKLMMLLKKLENKHPDHQGLMVKQFIEESEGLTGFAAIHQLLGARPEHLAIRTESGYTNAVMSAKKFIALYSSIYDETDKPSLNLLALNVKKNRKKTRSFFIEAEGHLREIDQQLRLLHDDKYLIDDESPLVRIYGSQKIRELVTSGIRQDKSSFKSSLISARKVILELIDLEHQNFTPDEIIMFYKMAGKKNIGLKEQAALLMSQYEKRPIDVDMTENYLRIRYQKCWEMMANIDKKINDLNGDKIMLIMDKDFIDNSTGELAKLRQKIATLVSLDHLSNEEKTQLKTMLEHEENFIYKLIHRKKQKDLYIDGALAKAFSEPSAHAPQESTQEENKHDPMKPELLPFERKKIVEDSDESEIVTVGSDESEDSSEDEEFNNSVEEQPVERQKFHYAYTKKRIYAQPDG